MRRAKQPAWLFNIYFKNGLTKSRTSCRSVRKTPPVPAQLLFRPKDVIPATTLLFPRKFGPPESPKHVPPVA